jgi:hypothetical protein
MKTDNVSSAEAHSLTPIFMKTIGYGCELDITGSARRPTVVSCENSTQTLVPLKGENLLKCAIA